MFLFSIVCTVEILEVADLTDISSKYYISSGRILCKQFNTYNSRGLCQDQCLYNGLSRVIFSCGVFGSLQCHILRFYITIVSLRTTTFLLFDINFEEFCGLVLGIFGTVLFD